MRRLGRVAMVADTRRDAGARMPRRGHSSRPAGAQARQHDRVQPIVRASAEAARYSALLEAVVQADAPTARQAVADLLARGADSWRVYRVVVRRLLSRAVAPARGGAPHGLWALNATLFVVEKLPPIERASLMAYAVGLAVADWPAHTPEPRVHHMPRAAGGALWSSQALAGQVRAAALAGEAARAEGALATLLVGANRGTAPDAHVRREAYAAVLDAAAHVEASHGGWGHLLVGAQHAVEMAELLSPAETLLALRPALAAVAHVAAARRSRTITLDESPFGSSRSRCAYRLNRRPGRAGEALQWAAALRAGPVARVVEEALVSGLEVSALLDAAMLVAAEILATTRPQVIDPAADGKRKRLAALALHTVLALHAARRAGALAPPSHDALAAALGLLDRLVRHAPALPARACVFAGAPSPQELARTVATRPGEHTLALVEAMLAEYDEVQRRDSEVATALLRATGAWLGIVPSDLRAAARDQRDHG